MSTKEHCLTTVVTESVPALVGQISTLGVVCSDTRLKVLSQPVGVREGQVRKSSLPLHKIPGRPDVVIPGDDPLDRVTDHIDIDWHVQVKLGEIREADMLNINRRWPERVHKLAELLLLAHRQLDCFDLLRAVLVVMELVLY